MLWVLIPIILIGAPIAAIGVLVSFRDRVRRLERRLERLEYLEGRQPGAEPHELPLGHESELTPPEPTTPPTFAAPSTPPIATPSVSPVHATLQPPALPHAPQWGGRPRPTETGSRAVSSATLEQWIGSVWLQNVGSVLVLVGVFLMILWGYTSGRVGPLVLVVSGVLLGLTLVWRGDRVARTVPPFGHALIGIGLGVAYLTLYLGHVRLGVLPSWAAFGALVVVSFGSVLAGMRYRVQTIAALGVIGAFLPFFMASWLPIGGLWMNPAGLLAYLAVVNAFVLVMGARSGWSGLDVTGLLLGTVAWIWSFHSAAWGWGIQSGLSVLFTLFGFAPLPRLVGAEGRVRPIDLAAIALAPLCLVAASWPFLAHEGSIPVAILLLVLATVQLLAALWVDTQRPERDLWRPLTAAAIVFLAAALERAVGVERTPLALCVEGVALIGLGVTARGGGWLRFWGSSVVGIGLLWNFALFQTDSWTQAQSPLFYFESVRGLVCIAAALISGYFLARNRDALSVEERWTPEVWSAAGHLMLLLWSGREAGHLATVVTSTGRLAVPAGVSVAVRREDLRLALCGAAWMLQATVLALTVPNRGGTFRRLCAAGIGLVAFAAVCVRQLSADGWGVDMVPGLDVMAVLSLTAILLAMVISIRMAERREDPTSGLAEAWALAASVLLLMWTSRESGHVARSALGTASPTQIATTTAAITSGAWIVQATVLLVTGWMRRSAFLRWCGLALFGLTVLKFLIVDLQTVDVFWRFVTAIGAGVAMLGISYFYRKRVHSTESEEKTRRAMGQ